MDPRAAVLVRYGLGAADLLGHGGESEVYALDDHRVLRLHRQEAAEYTRHIGELCGSVDRRAVAYALPEILEVHGDGEVSWSIERRLVGRSFDALLPALRGADRHRALTAYVDGAAAFGALGPPSSWAGGYGELFTDEMLRADRWGDLLHDRLALQRERARPFFSNEPGFESAADVILALARAEEAPGRPTLVHGDWFPGNVLLDDDLAVSAAIDLGWLSVVGDPSHDVRSAVVFCEVRPWGQPGDDEVLVAAAARHLGGDAAEEIDRTRRFEQLRFAFVDDDVHLHAWCRAGLTA